MFKKAKKLLTMFHVKHCKIAFILRKLNKNAKKV